MVLHTWPNGFVLSITSHDCQLSYSGEKQLEKIRREFFWAGKQEGAGKISWVSWEKTLLPKEKGGLGIGSLQAANLGLLLKWWWRFKNEESLWKQNHFLPPYKVGIGGTWKAVVNARKELLDFGIDPLVKFRWIDNNRWSWEDKGNYLTRFVREEIDQHLGDNSGEIIKWNNWIPKKVNIMVWRAGINRLPSLVELVKRGVHIQSITCSACNMEDETLEHILIGCSKYMEVWQKIGGWCRLTPLFAFSINDLFTLHESLVGTDTWKQLIGSIIKITAWCIWKDKNKRVMEGAISKPGEIVDQVKLLSRLWIANRSPKVLKNWSNWQDFHLC